MTKIKIGLTAALLMLQTWSSNAAEPFGHSFADGNASANSSVILISASSNVAGAYLRTAVLNANASTFMELDAIFPDATTRIIFQVGVNSGGFTTANLPFALYFPAGVAIQARASGSGVGGYGISYDLVSN